jgi:hypothetical protein
MLPLREGVVTNERTKYSIYRLQSGSLSHTTFAYNVIGIKLISK